jgi:hypothetical protein
MADAGVWNIPDVASVRTVYVNINRVGPLVVYRIHNDGPSTVFAGNAAEGDAGGAAIPPGSDCDISGSPIAIGIAGHKATIGSGTASGTYELICCQPGA